MIRPSALLRAARDIAVALCRSDDDLRAELRRKQLTIGALEAALGGLRDRVAELETDLKYHKSRLMDAADHFQAGRRDGLKEQAEQLAQANARIRELESERAWKPWPPEVMDGREFIVRTVNGSHWIGRANNSLAALPSQESYCELPAYVTPEVQP